MTNPEAKRGGHAHEFLGKDHARNERRVWLVIALTVVMMVAEITAGKLFGSMALTADGWHMATHAGAMLIAAFAYFYARRENGNPRFTFGTGKLGDLAAFASAVLLALIAQLIGWESGVRLANPVKIDFGQSILVAAVGLAVNLASAWLLNDSHHHGHRHHHGHSHPHHPHGHAGHGHHDDHDHHDHQHHDAHHLPSHGHERRGADSNLRAAYLHVLADALTSVLAILALVFGLWNNWAFLDPLIGIVGALVIARWSWGLIRSTGTVLLDALPAGETLPKEIREVIETPADRITDLHVWQVGPGHHAAIVSLVTSDPKEPGFYKAKLASLHELSHVTVEVATAA